MMDTNAIAEEQEISLFDLLQTLVDNLRLLVLWPLAAGLLALLASFTVTPSYTAQLLFLPPQQPQSAAASMLASLGNLGGLASAAGGLKNPADQYIAFMKSLSIKDALIDRFKLQVHYSSRTRSDARRALDQATRISSGKDGLIKLEFEASNPQLAADVANAYVEELRHLISRLSVTEAQQRRLFFEKQLHQSRKDLEAAETALKATGISDSVLKSNPVSAVGSVAALRAQITAQEVKIGTMRGYLAETAPDFKQALNELTQLRSQLNKQDIGTEPASGDGQRSSYISRYRDFKYHETLFELFARQYEIARVDEAREGAIIQVLDAAQPPERKSKPRRTMIACIAALVTGLLLLLFVFARQGLRQAVHDPETAHKIASLQASWQNSLRLRTRTPRL